MNDTYKKIGERVKHHRTNRGLSQDQLADGICSRQTISLLENGQHFPSADFMKQIAAKLGVPFHEIMVDEAKELEAKVQLDIIEVYIETGDYANSFPLIEELEGNEELLEYQRRELVLSKAECLMRTKKADQAVEILSDLQQRLELDRENDDHLMIKVYNRLGNSYYLVSDFTKAYTNYQRAYQLSLRYPLNMLSADVTYNLGIICSLMKKKQEALDYYTLAKEYYDQVSDLRKLADAYFNLALVYKDMNNLSQTAHFLEKAKVLFESLGMHKRAIQAKQQYAFYVLAEQEQDEAIDKLLECAKEFEDLGDTPKLAHTYGRLATVYLKKGLPEKSKTYLDVALGLFTNDMAVVEPYFTTVYFVSAMFYLEVRQFDRCVELSCKAAEIFDKMGLSGDATECLQLAASGYREQGMFEQSNHILQQMVDLLRRF